ncbi:hypothetical protein HGRIS_012405 [Hohenbuehelia grisea]|uniref:Uncharacterized protein n=1 Tax=Hohenbuehelia grisea TaxID=104357 RepID=A0ABR3IS84_9AGAR
MRVLAHSSSTENLLLTVSRQLIIYNLRDHTARFHTSTLGFCRAKRMTVYTLGWRTDDGRMFALNSTESSCPRGLHDVFIYFRHDRLKTSITHRHVDALSGLG